MDKLINILDMENEKEVIELLQELSEIKDDYLPTRLKLWAKQILSSISSAPREPEAINRNEQAKEFCQCSDDAKLMFVCKDCGKEWLVDERQNG